VNFNEYQQIQAINFSTLKYMAVSPLKYKYMLEHPKPPTPDMLLGSAIHIAILEPEQLLLRCVLWEGDRRGNKWKEFKAAHAGKIILTQSEYETCLDIKEAVLNHPEAGTLIKGGKSEVTVTWEDDQTGLSCKGRIDHVTPEGHLVDLKTTKTDIDQRRFGASATHMFIHAQMAMYTDGLTVTNKAPEKQHIIAVEQLPPHDVAVFPMWDVPIDVGRKKYQSWLANLQECLMLDKWPGRYPEEVPFDMPSYAMESDDFEF
jgi:hypothetical protein